MFKKTLIPLVILVALGGLYWWYSQQGEGPTAPTGETEQQQIVQLTTKAAREDAATYSIDVQYPQFGIPIIDADIQSRVEGVIKELKDMSATPADPDIPKNSLDGKFESVYIGSDIVSAKLILSQYTGGAHPLDLVSGINYDRATGRTLELRDVLSMTGLSIEQLSAEASARLKEKLGDVFAQDGASTNPENFSSFVVSADSVTFIFQPYQVAPYAAGPQEVSFPRTR